MAERTRQESREAFILHGYPYRETSLLLETFTRAFGRVSMVARGARSPRSPLRGVLLAFQPLALSWFGKGELRTLASSRRSAHVRVLSQRAPAAASPPRRPP